MDGFVTPPAHAGFQAKKRFGAVEGRFLGASVADMEPGGGPTVAHTRAHDHLFLVLKGEAEIRFPDSEKTVAENDAVLVKGTLPRSVWNRGDSAASRSESRSRRRGKRKKRMRRKLRRADGMLDKSVPYYEIYMRRAAGAPIPEFALPDGFRFVFYKDGDEKAWAEIEASVGEFDNAKLARGYYEKTFLPYRDELKKRCLFVRAPDGKKVATATAWYDEKDPTAGKTPWLHWVSVKPGFQGLGIGKAVVFRAVTLLKELNGDRDFYLHTQTWSHKAVKIYEKAGFRIAAEPTVAGHENKEYEKALAILKALDAARK